MVSRFAIARVDPRAVALVVAGTCAACGLLYLAYSLTMRPYGAVEAELAFEASRIQRGFPLYRDPTLGAWEAGAPPSRYYVLYTPLWPWLLAHLSPPTLLGIRTVGRAINAVVFLATLGAIARASQPRRRLATVTGALLALGFFMIVREASLADADMPAVALATLGLVRLQRKRGLDVLSAAMLAAAPLVKPSVLGIAAGAVMAHLIVHRRRGARRLLLPLAAGGAVGGALVALFFFWSHGAWLAHIVRATGQTLSFERWVQEFGGRAAFLGAPHILVGILAVRRRSPLTATLPLATSLAWSIFSMAKHGSGTHYWLEPTMAALVAIGQLGQSARAPARGLAWTAAAFTVAAAAASLPAFARAPGDDIGRRDMIARLRDHCTLAPGQVLISSDVTLELELDGRVVVPAWQNSYLVRSGKFPLDAWRRDLGDPHVQWFVHGQDYREPPPLRIAGITEVSAFRKELRDAIEANFVYDATIDGLLVFRRR